MVSGFLDEREFPSSNSNVSAVRTLHAPNSDVSLSSAGTNFTPRTSQTPDCHSSQPSMTSVSQSQRAAAPSRRRTPSLGSSVGPKMRDSVPSTPSSEVSASPTRGSKRAINGAVKPSTPGSVLSPSAKYHGGIGHSRNQSLDSNASRVSEVSWPTQPMSHFPRTLTKMILTNP